MDKAELETLVAKALEEHPEVFPSSRELSNLLKSEYEAKVNHHTIIYKFDFPSLQLKWIENSEDKVFFSAFVKRRFTKTDKKCIDAARKRFEKKIELILNELEDFPGSPQIVEAFRERTGVILNPATISTNFDLVPFQLEWINSCEDWILIKSISGHKFGFVDEKCKKAVKKRFKKIAEAELKKSLEDYPSARIIAILLKAYGAPIDRGTVIRNLDIFPIQLEWIKSSKKELFLKDFHKGTFGKMRSKRLKDAVKKRFVSIVREELKGNPEIFPSTMQIADFLNKKYDLSISNSTINRRLNLQPFKINWVKCCENRVLLENITKGTFAGESKIVKELARRKFKKIIENELQNNPDVFPSRRKILELLKNYGIEGLTPSMAFNDLDVNLLKLKWINSSVEALFLEQLSKGTFGKLDKKCKKAVDKRMHDILLSHIDDLSGLLINKQTLNSYLKKFPELAFLLTATQEHKFTIDQRIVLDMHLWKETRSEDLHKLIGERLEQLWGFRELFALMKDGRCLDADVISMFHETLSDRIGNYVPKSAVIHSFVDNLRAGNFNTREGKDVLLLSFMHWLTDKQSAEIMLRLNQSVGTDNAIYMTSPNGLEYAEDIITSMNTFGFVPEKVGSLYLLPPGESDQDEQRKLLTKGKVLQFRKLQDVDRTPEELQLFLKEKRRKGGVRPEPKADIISYDEDTLKDSLPLITMKDVGIVFTEEPPEVKKVEVEDDKAILTLEGGAVLGFHVEPEHPYSIEVEGRKIPKGTDNAILDVMNEKEGFEVAKGLKRKYKQFLKLIKDKREQIGAIRKTKLKRKR